jgi:hypothetical protein
MHEVYWKQQTGSRDLTGNMKLRFERRITPPRMEGESIDAIQATGHVKKIQGCQREASLFLPEGHFQWLA